MPKKKASEPRGRVEAPALDPDAREQQLIAMAVDRAEQQLRDGTASSQVITHFLKLGSSRERIEKDILRKQEELYSAKTKAYESAQDVKELYAQAIAAVRKYSGNGDPEDYEDEPD